MQKPKKTIFPLSVRRLLLLVILLTIPGFFGYAQHKIHLHQLPTEGLSDPGITAIYQDHQGFLWLGTQHGLNRFDGYDYLVFNHSGEDASSLSSNQINTIIEDSQNRLWIGTKYGLNVFDRQTKTFKKYLPATDKPHAIPGKNIKVLFVDHQNNLWIGTNEGLAKFREETDDFLVYKNLPNEPNGLSGNDINTLVEDHLHRLWIGTNYAGISLLNPETGQFRSFMNQNNNPYSLSGNTVISIFEDSYQNIWVGTLQEGLNKYDTKTNQFKRYLSNDSKQSIATNSIYSISEDMDRKLVVGGMQGGMSIYNRQSDTFIRYTTKGHINHRGNTASVLTDYMNEDKQLLIATSNGGVTIYDNFPSQINAYQSIPGSSNSLSINHISSLIEDQGNSLWIGTDGGGLNHLDLQTGEFVHYLKNSQKGALPDNTILDIEPLAEANQYLLLTQLHGLVLFDKNTKTFEALPVMEGFKPETFQRINRLQDGRMLLYGKHHYAIYSPQENKTLIASEPLPYQLTTYIQGPEGQAYFGTDEGLMALRLPDKTNFHSAGKLSPIPSARLPINSLATDPTGKLLIGTNDGQIFHFDQNELRPLTNSMMGQSPITNLLVSKDKLWATNSSGIWVNGYSDMMEAAGDQWKLYNKQDGLAGNVSKAGTLALGLHGNLYLGSIEGLSIFHPDSLLTNPIAPQAIITSIESPSKELNKSWAQTDLNTIQKIQLDPRQASIKFTFASSNFIKSSKNKYKYRLLGKDEEWQVSQQRSASYTNLPPGNYTLQLLASNNDGVWASSPKTISVTVPPLPLIFWYWSLPIALISLSIGYLLWFRYRKSGQTRAMIPEDKVEIAEKKVKTDPFFEEIDRIILDNLENESFDNKALCTAMGMSRAQLYRKFKENSALTLSAHIKKVKLIHASKLLRTTSLSVSEAASQSGFKNISHFSKSFQQEFNMTPSVYATSFRELAYDTL